MWQLDPADRDRNEVLALFADQLTLGQKFAQVFADPALDNLPESLVIFFDLQDHESALFFNTDANT